MRIKEGKFSVYEIDPMYLEYLSKYDKNVRKKSNRKYYGILITKEKTDYCIPFTSKVKKRNPKLTINIKNKKEVIAQLTINNMIPVIDDVVHKVNIKNDKSKYYLYRELYFLRKYDVIQEILNKAEKVLNVLNNKLFHHLINVLLNSIFFVSSDMDIYQSLIFQHHDCFLIHRYFYFLIFHQQL